MKIDLAKRKEVMQRSIKLGHCICEPRRACPCDVFTDRGFCPCAGERPDPVPLEQVKLTALVKNPGCASKIPPGDLEGLLSRLPAVNDPAVVSGLAAADDAAIYNISDTVSLVQTVDVFTPCVDDPHLFGRICAANCLSDIYAMGGEPRTALSVLAFPSETLSGEIMFQMLAGAMQTLAEANVALVGGHSIKDEEIKLGFAITGTVDPETAAALDSPQAGDVLVLTKPLGTGVLAFARQVKRATPEILAPAELSMAALNRAAAEAMREAGASACTDITGFGLFGHLLRLLRPRHLHAVIDPASLPSFDGVRALLSDGVIPGAIERNREFAGGDLHVGEGVDPASVHLGFDAQTSGGLLIAIARPRLAGLLEKLSRRGVSGWVIGELREAAPARITLAPAAAVPVTSTPQTMSANPVPDSHGPGCCAEVFDTASSSGSVAETRRAFGAFMRAAQAPGALNERTKELITFGLVLQSRCAPCFRAHYEKARELGITPAELEEVAWCAIAMGGAPVRMFYQERLEALTEKSKV